MGESNRENPCIVIKRKLILCNYLGKNHFQNKIYDAKGC